MSYHLLAVDPGLASLGIVILDVTGYGRWTSLYAETVHTYPRDAIHVRLNRIRRSVSEVVEEFHPQAAVIECNHDTKIMQRGKFKGDATSINKLMLATGVVYGALPLPSSYVDMVSTNRWWPRIGRTHMPEADLVAQIRTRLGIDKGEWSEHALTAAALGDWWTRHDGLRHIGQLAPV